MCASSAKLNNDDKQGRAQTKKGAQCVLVDTHDPVVTNIQYQSNFFEVLLCF